MSTKTNATFGKKKRLQFKTFPYICGVKQMGHEMIEIEKKIFVHEDIVEYEHEYVYGATKNDNVLFGYHNKRTNVTKTIKIKNYNHAFSLAKRLAKDGRYKNYDFLIYLP